MQKLLAQIVKFGIVGVIAFAIDFGVLVFLTEVFGLNPVVSATISFIVSVIFNYLASMRYVFSHREGMSRQREFVIFVVLSAVGLGINDALMWLGTEVVTLDYRLVKLVATAVVMVWNFRDPQDLPRGRREQVAPAGWGKRPATTRPVTAPTQLCRMRGFLARGGASLTQS